jgi:hypothetical protein
MAAHEHLSRGQFHRRPGRPNDHEHEAGEEEDGTAPRKIRPRVHQARPLPKHRGRR